MSAVNRALAAFAVLLAASVAAAQGGSESKVRVKRAVLDDKTLVIDLKIEPSWHIYSVNGDSSIGNATKIKVDRPAEIAGPIGESEPVRHKKDYTDPETKEILYSEDYLAHEGEITIRVPVRGAGAGPVKGSIDVTACDADMCLPPGTVSFRAEAGTAAAAGGAASRESSPGATKTAGTSGPDTRVAPAPAADTRRAEPQGPGSKPGPSGRKVVSEPKRAGKPPANDPVKIVEIAYPEEIREARFDLRVVLEIAPEYHIYWFKKEQNGVPTTFHLTTPPESPVTFAVEGDPKTDVPPHERKKEFEQYHYMHGRVAIDVPVTTRWAPGKRPEGGAPAAVPFRLVIDYQTCTWEFCLVPTTAEFDLATSVRGGPDGLAAAVGPQRIVGTNGNGSKDAAKDAAQPAQPGVVATMSFEPATLAPKSKATLVVKLRRGDGQPILAGNAAPRVDLVEAVEIATDGPATAFPERDGSVTLRVPVTIGADARDGSVAVTGRASIGALETDFTGVAVVMAPWLGFILIAIGSAFGALLTPCVFPMIPVTMSFFTKQAETGQAHPAKLAFLYGIGIVASFTAIGAAFAALLGGTAANEFAGHWITQLVITVLFVFFALSLLGMFDLSVPQPIMRMVERSTTRRLELAQSGRGVSAAVLMMGLLFSVTTFTCTAPFIGGLLLGASSSTGGLGRPIVGMLAFSLALAVPFFFLALFPSQLKKLPKAGGWLNETKVVMGFIELAAAVKFLNGVDLSLKWGVFTRNVCLALWIAIHALTGLYLLGLFRLPKDMPRQKTGVIPLLIAMTFLTIAIYLATGLNGKPLAKFVEGWLPPIEEEYSRAAFVETGGHGIGGDGIGRAKTGWPHRFEDDYDGALKEALEHGLPLFVDFTGYTCANCRAVEAVIFMKNRDAQTLLNEFVVAELHLDGGDGDVKLKNNDLVRKFDVGGMPTYVLVDPRTERKLMSWGWANADPAEWKRLLKDATERWKTLRR
jgi:thiol:disulfide interchange protein